MDLEPRYKHDCAACTFLGHSDGYDLYHCSQHGHPMLIARYSEVKSDFSSCLAESAGMSGHRPFIVALVRATRMGLPLGGGALAAG